MKSGKEVSSLSSLTIPTDPKPIENVYKGALALARVLLSDTAGNEWRPLKETECKYYKCSQANELN